MDPDGTDKSRSWLAVTCGRDGTIVQTLRDDLGLVEATPPGARLTDLVDSGSVVKAQNLIATLAARDCVVGWQLNVRSGSTARPLYFAGANGDQSLLVLAAPDARSVTELFDDIATANLDVSSALRTLLHEQRTGITDALRRDNDLYEELSRLNNELINRERELARKTAALERVAAEKSRLVAIAAHDLRNPLTIVSSYASLLKRNPALSEDERFDVEEIERSARFMTELVEEMLDSARLESGHIDADFQEIDLVAAARHAAIINRIRAERKEIAVSFETETEKAMIRADPIKLRQMINNLVVNAIKFSPVRSRIAIRVRGNESRAILEVEDRGIGIPRDQIAVIFEPFKTLHPAGTAGEKSTGLGLAIVKQLVALHRAAIEVESEEGSGSVFRIAFPAAQA